MSQLRHVGSSALRPGSKPGPPHWELSILAAGPPGNSLGVRSHKKDLYIQVVFTEWKKPVGVYPGDSGAHLLPHPRILPVPTTQADRPGSLRWLSCINDGASGIPVWDADRLTQKSCWYSERLSTDWVTS